METALIELEAALMALEDLQNRPAGTLPATRQDLIRKAHSRIKAAQAAIEGEMSE